MEIDFIVIVTLGTAIIVSGVVCVSLRFYRMRSMRSMHSMHRKPPVVTYRSIV